ncbi:AtpZ/AtpI family protein [Candidatus Uhrbacteria bacterium]|nr:AtpZ/AtpI family protein [Candidatus Uhrbacteria bacterium]
MQKNTEHPWKLVSFALELGFLITIPLLALALAGRFLDATLKSSPLFFLLAVILSIVISSSIVVKKVGVLIGEEENRDRPDVDPSSLGDTRDDNYARDDTQKSKDETQNIL